ncbi:MAG: toxin [Candidatus Omnitrophota bacterium]|nr:toxin [Candidatus Omnitrophota bacterium]
MGYIRWDSDKNNELKAKRGVSFEEILVCLENEQVLDIIRNPGTKRQDQMVFVVRLNNYVYYVPFVEDKEGVFLKTIIPSRKLLKRYLKEREGGE